MTIQNTTLRKAGPSQGNGVTTVFPFTFKVFTATDILVTYLDALDVESVLVLSTNYTVSLNADQNTSPGGSVTLLVAPATATYITLTSQLANTQTLALTNSGGFYPESINNALDRTVIEIQQLAEQASRAVTIPKSSTASPLLPSPAANNVLVWNNAATALTNLPATTGTSLVNLAASTGSTLVGTTSGGTGAVTRTVASKLNDTVSVKDFGAVGDGVTDDTVAIQNAVTSLSINGGVVLFPKGTFLVSSTINVGNGTSAAIATKMAITLQGVGSCTYFGDTYGSAIKWIGAAGGTVISYNGSGDGYGLQGIHVDCNLLAGAGIAIYSVRGSSFNNFSIVNFTAFGLDLGIQAGPLASVIYSNTNSFNNFLITSTSTAGVIGLRINGDYTNNNDWHGCTFNCGVVQVAKATSGTAFAGYLNFTDSNTFNKVDFNVYGAGTGFGLMLNGYTNNAYPQNNFFNGCSILSVTTYESGVSFIGNNTFYNATSMDGETLPSHPKLSVISDTGIMAGPVRTNLPFNSAGFMSYTSSATLSTADFGRAMYYQGANGTLTLPAASSQVGGIISVFNIAGGGACTVQRAGSDTLFFGGIAGGLAVTLQAGESIALVSNGAIWFQLNYSRSTFAYLVINAATYTLIGSDFIIVCNYATGTMTLTLPAPSTNTNRELIIENNQNQLVVSASANVVPLIGGAAGTAILPATAGRWVTLISNGTNWQAIQGN